MSNPGFAVALGYESTSVSLSFHSSSHVSEAVPRKSGWEDPGGEKIMSQGWGQPPGGAGNSERKLSGPEAHIPSLLSMATRNHMDITTPPLPPVAPEVLRVAEHRHRRGLMYPFIYHVLTKVRNNSGSLLRGPTEQ